MNTYLKRLFEDISNQLTGQVDDHEVEMAITDLRAIADMAAKLAEHLSQENPKELEGWVQAKITKAADYVESVYKNHVYSDHDCGCGSNARGLTEIKSFTLDSESASDSDKITDFLTKNDISFKKEGSKIKISLDRSTPKASSILGKLKSLAKFKELNEANSTCCGRCGHFHVKGTPCPKPFLTGDSHCSKRPR
jgi:hypothetical protein